MKNQRSDDRMARKALIFICCLLFSVSFLLLLPGCKKKEEAKPPVPVIVNVWVQTAEIKTIIPSIEAIGTLNPYAEVIVSSEVAGILDDVKVDEGTIVSKGMVLAIIDDTDYRLSAEMAKADLRKAEANLNNTRLTFERRYALAEEGLVTRQKFDDISARLAISEANVDIARAALNTAKERLDRTTIYSPLSGAIKKKKVSAGSFVGIGSPLFVVIQNDPLRLSFTIAERYVGKVRRGQEVAFRVGAFPDIRFKGTLDIIYPSLDERTRRLRVEAIVPNPNRLLKPGFFANATLYIGAKRDIVVVPTTSLIFDSDGIRVFVIEDHRAVERFVKVGMKYEGVAEIIEGIEKGEEVVTAGQHNLFGGVKVNVAH